MAQPAVWRPTNEEQLLAAISTGDLQGQWPQLRLGHPQRRRIDHLAAAGGHGLLLVTC